MNFVAMYFTGVSAGLGTALLIESNSFADGVDVLASVVQAQTKIRLRTGAARQGVGRLCSRNHNSAWHGLGRRGKISRFDHVRPAIRAYPQRHRPAIGR